MKRILVPTDFSDHAEYALKVAAQIARENDSEIMLVHMLELPHEASDAVGSGSDIPEIMFFKNKAIQNLDDLMDAPYLDGLNVSEAVHFSKASEGITALAKKTRSRFHRNGITWCEWV
ncbi:universal stress protein [Flavobacterium sp. N1718]|uniref:universal stress protein n=1 Tax=Flavobacterium sp. N1718 TaxID=2986822 RepID=UPI0029CAB7BD|nr:universal stress protein [Flavobacterium sp. N1718]